MPTDQPPFIVYEFSGAQIDQLETLGTKEKFWLQPDPGQLLPPSLHLFKVGREGTGENWSEKIASEFAKEINLPTAQYEFAVIKGQKGTISPRFLPESAHLVSANYFFSRVIDGYQGSKQFERILYKLPAAFRILNPTVNRPAPLHATHRHLTLAQIFIGYLVFDSFIGNTDRHDENWGFVIENDPVRMSLAPTFDHASSLGRNETDERRLMRLNTRDKRADVEAYASKARSAFFNDDHPPKTMTHREVLTWLARRDRETICYWYQQLGLLTDEKCYRLFSRVPDPFISQPSIDFAMRLIRHNRAMIAEVASV